MKLFRRRPADAPVDDARAQARLQLLYLRASLFRQHDREKQAHRRLMFQTLRTLLAPEQREMESQTDVLDLFADDLSGPLDHDDELNNHESDQD